MNIGSSHPEIVNYMRRNPTGTFTEEDIIVKGRTPDTTIIETYDLAGIIKNTQENTFGPEAVISPDGKSIDVAVPPPPAGGNISGCTLRGIDILDFQHKSTDLNTACTVSVQLNISPEFIGLKEGVPDRSSPGAARFDTYASNTAEGNYGGNLCFIRPALDNETKIYHDFSHVHSGGTAGNTMSRFHTTLMCTSIAQCGIGMSDAMGSLLNREAAYTDISPSAHTEDIYSTIRFLMKKCIDDMCELADDIDANDQSDPVLDNRSIARMNLRMVNNYLRGPGPNGEDSIAFDRVRADYVSPIPNGSELALGHYSDTPGVYENGTAGMTRTIADGQSTSGRGMRFRWDNNLADVALSGDNILYCENPWYLIVQPLIKTGVDTISINAAGRVKVPVIFVPHFRIKITDTGSAGRDTIWYPNGHNQSEWSSRSVFYDQSGVYRRDRLLREVPVSYSAFIQYTNSQLRYAMILPDRAMIHYAHTSDGFVGCVLGSSVATVTVARVTANTRRHPALVYSFMNNFYPLGRLSFTDPVAVVTYDLFMKSDQIPSINHVLAANRESITSKIKRFALSQQKSLRIYFTRSASHSSDQAVELNLIKDNTQFHFTIAWMYS